MPDRPTAPPQPPANPHPTFAGGATLIEATFLARPNRFAAWVEVDGRREHVHVPDPGRLRELLIPGRPVWLRPAAGETRRTHYSLVLTRDAGQWISLDTGIPNKAVRQALLDRQLPEFAGYDQVRHEFPFGASRLDFLLTGPDGPCLLEVKSVTLVVDGTGLFPDAVSERASRHLRELIHALSLGYRAAALFVVQRDDAVAVAPNEGMDPGFAAALRQAAAAGVRLLARSCLVSPEGVVIGRPLPVLTRQP